MPDRHIRSPRSTGTLDDVGSPRDIVSLLTDYGTRDEFVGVVKSVILDTAPHVRFVDVSHDVAPFDVRGGALALCRAIQYLPDGIVLAVVDPGVGTGRRRIAIEVAGGAGILLGPDNGLLAPAVALVGGADRAFELNNTALHLPAPGATFDGRDVFAPVAGFLCNGGDLTEVGDVLDADLLVPGVVPLPSSVSHPTLGDGLRCEVTWVDRFGNCQLNIAPGDLGEIGAGGTGSTVRIEVGDDVRSARLTESFAEVGSGAVGLVVDSYGMLALSMDRRSAAEEFGLGSGDAVSVFPGDAATDAPSVAVRLRK
jgi:hypothetical protein